MTTPETIEALRAELVELLGERGVSADPKTRERASVDEATMSPILSEQLPLGLADLVAYPANAEQIAAVVAAATRHRVPVTARGKGTGNYGQGIPLQGGLVLDTTRARAIVEVGDGVITAEAGASMVQLERAHPQFLTLFKKPTIRYSDETDRDKSGPSFPSGHVISDCDSTCGFSTRAQK